MVTSGDGMMIQLRTSDGPQPAGSSGFDGAEYLELLKNVHVVMHDVGKSGMMPGTKPPSRSVKRSSQYETSSHRRAHADR